LDYPGAEEVGQTLITCSSWTGIFENGQLRTYMLPFVDYTGTHWDNNQDYAKAILTFKRINSLPVPKAMHNGMYDVTHSMIYNAPPLNFNPSSVPMNASENRELLATGCSSELICTVSSTP